MAEFRRRSDNEVRMDSRRKRLQGRAASAH